MRKKLFCLFFVCTCFNCFSSTEYIDSNTDREHLTEIPKAKETTIYESVNTENSITPESASSVSSEVDSIEIKQINDKKKTAKKELSFDDVTEIIMNREWEQYKKTGRSMFY